MGERLQDLARQFAQARKRSAELRAELTAVQATVSALRPQINQAIVDAAREGMQQTEIVRLTGYSRERVRQLCRAAGVEPAE